MALTKNGRRIGRPPRNAAVISHQRGNDMDDANHEPEAGPALMGSQDFKDAVAAAVRDALTAERASRPQTDGIDIIEALKMLAKEITNSSKEAINSEKRQRGESVPLTADEEQARGAARKRMGALIMATRKLGNGHADIPLYRVMAPVWLNEHLVMPYQRVAKEADPQPVRIRYTSEPNLQMVPINDTAKGIYSEYLRYLGGTGAINEVINQFGISLTNRAEQWVSEKGRLTTVAPSESHRMMHHIEMDAVDLAAFERPATGADDAMRIMTADDPRSPSMAVLGSVHEPARRGTLTDKVSLQNVS
jgi:hypothetical protein